MYAMMECAARAHTETCMHAHLVRALGKDIHTLAQGYRDTHPRNSLTRAHTSAFRILSQLTPIRAMHTHMHARLMPSRTSRRQRGTAARIHAQSERKACEIDGVISELLRSTERSHSRSHSTDAAPVQVRAVRQPPTASPAANGGARALPVEESLRASVAAALTSPQLLQSPASAAAPIRPSPAQRSPLQSRVALITRLERQMILLDEVIMFKSARVSRPPTES